ncbi:MAG: hypothetical protein AVDCRST_MAG56-6283 [uncultured Cytophagales bacterium]|uniref:Uncharacterized protein n=1 Tax=uncultured Cytophagales bacterium TaxID=158755 RepID=A0A6J4KQ97_9SPHI|nr:MAG: hypothetical protein AVDCRST_MAG56-6283 [uncultured Cytophagales bacterium]
MFSASFFRLPRGKTTGGGGRPKGGGKKTGLMQLLGAPTQEDG